MKSMITLLLSLAVVTLTQTSCAFKKEDDNSKKIAVPTGPLKPVTEKNYLSGRRFCAVYPEVTSKEKGRFVTVPVNYEKPELGTLEIYVYTLTAFDSKKPSYIFVDGGPGQNTHGIMKEFFDGRYNELRFDQRGLGCSAPDTYAKYLDPSLYSTEITVRDMEEIRKAYEISTWSVYGVSYGTVPATMYGSKYPEVTRSVVLEGVVGKLDQIHMESWKTEKLNLMIGNFGSEQRESLAKFLEENSADTEFILGLIGQLMYEDMGLRTGKAFLERIFKTDGEIDRAEIKRVREAMNGSKSKFQYPQQPGSIDSNVHYIIYCKNLAYRHTENKLVVYSADRGFFTQIGSPEEFGTTCDEAQVFEKDETPYLIAEYPVKKPVYYFQGSHDGATMAVGAIEHWKTVPQGESFFLLAQKGGHNPNLMRIYDIEAPHLAKVQKEFFLKGIADTKITKDDVSYINTYSSVTQRWLLFTDPLASAAELDEELSGLRVFRN